MNFNEVYKISSLLLNISGIEFLSYFRQYQEIIVSVRSRSIDWFTSLMPNFATRASMKKQLILSSDRNTKSNIFLQKSYKKKRALTNNLSKILKNRKMNENSGKSMSEALIFASTNPQYDDRLFIELQVQYMKIPSSNMGRTCCVHKLF